MLQQRTGRTHEVACSYELGDAKCGVNLADHLVLGVITEVLNQHRFEDSTLSHDDGWFNQGKVTFTSGNNAGLSMEIQRFDSSNRNFILSLDMPYPLQVGDAFDAWPGCDKTYVTCVGKFNNKNFSGFPAIPGTDFALSFPSAPTS